MLHTGSSFTIEKLVTPTNRFCTYEFNICRLITILHEFEKILPSQIYVYQARNLILTDRNCRTFRDDMLWRPTQSDSLAHGSTFITRRSRSFASYRVTSLLRSFLPRVCFPWQNYDQGRSAVQHTTYDPLEKPAQNWSFRKSVNEPPFYQSVFFFRSGCQEFSS